MDQTRVRDVIARTWADDVIPSLSGLIAIPALSPSFDAGWAATGQLRAAVSHVANWAGSRGLGRPEVVELDGRAPLLLIDIPATAGATAPGTVILYGHLDKQPPLGDWSEGLAAVASPCCGTSRLYGRARLGGRRVLGVRGHQRAGGGAGGGRRARPRGHPAGDGRGVGQRGPA